MKNPLRDCTGCAKRKAWLIKQAADMKARAKKVLQSRKPGTNAARTVIRKGG